MNVFDDEPTYVCGTCQDIGIIPTRTITRHGHEYTLHGPCGDCERGLLVLKGKRAEKDEDRKRYDRFLKNQRLPDAPPSKGSAWARMGAPGKAQANPGKAVQKLIRDAGKREETREQVVQRHANKIRADYPFDEHEELPF